MIFFLILVIGIVISYGVVHDHDFYSCFFDFYVLMICPVILSGIVVMTDVYHVISIVIFFVRNDLGFVIFSCGAIGNGSVIGNVSL